MGGAEINEAKKTLATAATAMLHGREKAVQAEETARKTFAYPKALAADLGQSSGRTSGVKAFAIAADLGLPSVGIPRAEIEAGLGVLAAFVKAGLVTSTGEARRQIKGGGLKVNDQTVTDERAMIGPRDLTGGAVKLSLGRKRHVLLKVA